MGRVEMVLKGSIFLAVLSSLICFAAGKNVRQSDALYHIFKEKLLNKASIYTELFVEDTKTLNENVFPVYTQESLKEQDKIEKLPGQPSVNFSQYGGYVTVEKSAGRAMYYYFVEADRHKETKPLLLWLNGGPGCSSLAFGAMEELGPFRVYSDGKTLYKNPYAWNGVANVLFLESPAGVGFSYSNTTSDYDTVGDRRTAIDNYVFLLNWLERFPEYKTRDFYISGESYAGHFVPQLADIIIQRNKIQGNKTSNSNIINLKGIIIGNAAINDETDTKGMYEYLWTHALISDKAYYNIKRYCDSSSNPDSQNSQCKNAATEVDADLFGVQIYDIYAPFCFASDVTDKPMKPSIMDFDQCSDNYVKYYLNRPDVQEALHANVTRLNYVWSTCSQVFTEWKDSASTILPLLRNAMANGIRVWVFSGDVDGRVPVTSSRSSLNTLKLAVNKTWYPWFLQQQNMELAGYSIVYKGGLTFATVRGAGHEVPSYQPKRALALIKHFLRGENLPETS